MAGAIGLICAFCIWAVLFKPFFGDVNGFRYALKCVFLRGHSHTWRWSENIGRNNKAVLKFVVWLILGSTPGYLVKSLVEWAM